MHPIYLDHNATTPIDPAVLDAMLPFLRAEFGNPSSLYPLGRRAHAAIQNARAEVAALIGASADEIIFTSGGTEASNIAIRGAVGIDAGRRAIVTTAIEHPATESCCTLLARAGHPVSHVPPRPDGLVDPQQVAKAIGEDAALVSVIHAQNEVGTIQPIVEIAATAKARGALVHADAAQSVGKVPVDVDALGVDLVSIAGHKLYAPKGIGALYVRRGVTLPPLLVGAGQERGRRPGTENVAAIVALGEACRIAGALLKQGTAHVATLAAELFARLRAEVPDIALVGHRTPRRPNTTKVPFPGAPDFVLVGHRTQRLPTTLNVLFPGVSGRRLLEACPRVQASTGSACHADSEDPSAILTALGIPRERALGAVRLSLGRTTTRSDVEEAASTLAEAWRLIARTARQPEGAQA